MESPTTTQPRRSVGCGFLAEPPTEIFSPEMFSSDEQLMIQSAEQFSRREVLPIQARLDLQEEPLMVNLIRKAGELGFCGVDAPEAFGGLGLSKNLAARILEFLSLNASLSVTIGVTSGISQIGLVLFGNDEQRSRFLPRLTSGEWIGAYALSEPNSGSDALSLSCRAEQRGNKWVLNGTKMWISNAKWADLFLVMAKIDGEHISAFLVERGMPGVEVMREEHKLGLKGSSTARLVLENAEVPLENLLHEPGKGHHVALNALNLGRFKLSSMSMGTAREALTQSSTYAKERRQFGQPISDFGLIQQKFANMAACYFAAESMIYRTGAHVDQAFEEQVDTPEGRRLAAEEFAVECSCCKVFSTEAQSFIVDEALQVYGGYGFTEEFPLARIYRDSRVSRIYEGTNEINRVFIADRFLKRVSEGRASALSAGDAFLSELAGRALKNGFQDQVTQGAISDLLILAYAEQSTRLRADRFGGIRKALYNVFVHWANLQGAAAYQLITGESVAIPSSAKFDIDSIADAVYMAEAPIGATL